MSRYVGKRVGDSRRTPPRPARGLLLVLALGVTATLIAWGVLVYLAIDFGGEARNGEQGAWLLLGFTSLGAVVCLFATLLLGARLIEVVTARPEAPHPGPPRVPGGRRAAR